MADLLRTARAGWARVKRAEELGTLLGTSPVSRLIKGGDLKEFHIDRLVNILRDNKSALAQSINRSLDRTPGARAHFEALLTEWKQIAPERVLAISDVSSLRRLAPVAAIDQMVSYLLTQPAGQDLFRQAIVFGRSKSVTPNLLAFLVNAARRREYGSGGAGEVAPLPGVSIGFPGVLPRPGIPPQR